MTTAIDERSQGLGAEGGDARGFERSSRLTNGRRYRDDGSETDGERLARALGIFSVGLGLTEILVPRALARAIGLNASDRMRKLLVTFGIRELGSGVGLLTRPDSAAFAWSRVVGDALDLMVLGSALSSRRSKPNRVAAAIAAVLGVAVLDVIAGKKLSQDDGTTLTRRRRRQRIEVRKAITVATTPDEVYRFWRNFENLPRFMTHLESVRVMDERRSYWKARAPLGTTVEWAAEIVDDRPGELIAWRSMEGAEVPNSGTVRFVPAPGDRGTEVQVELTYNPPGGVVGATVAKLFGEEPSIQVDGDLRRFKQVLEVGEVVHSDASIHRGPHPARPSADGEAAAGATS